MTVLNQTVRAEAIDLRTYRRPLDDSGSSFETREQMLRRAMVDHQKRLWKDAGGRPDKDELSFLESLGLAGLAAVAGRTQWLGGTPYAHSRPCSQFNCAGTGVATVYDMVDAAWLLLNGCGVGFKPVSGTLHGYRKPIRDLQIIPSEKPKDYKGREQNLETLPTPENNYTWTIAVGDSAEAWAKAGGKLFAPRSLNAERLVLDFSEIRGPGGRLKGYGWIANGAPPLIDAFRKFHDLLNDAAGNLLDEIQILDVMNLWGTVLSSRRAAELALLDHNNPRAGEFAQAKKDYWLTGKTHRRQSNNTLLFWAKPSRSQIEELIRAADECGGDPGIANGNAAIDRCPWFYIMNPCAEILLPRTGFCNLVSNCLPRFRRNFNLMERSVYTIARANYRQTCVNMEDGTLQPSWHQTNQSLRLCGVSMTGIVQADWLTDHQIRRLRNAAIAGAYSMADELNMPRPKAVCTIKPEGTGTKTLGSIDLGEITEGIHRPLGKYIFNWVNFSTNDPLVSRLEAAGYRVILNPSDPNNTLVCFPVEYHGVKFTHHKWMDVNLESAVEQLNRYRRWNTLWADYNVSCTVSYSPDEIPFIADWIDQNWDNGFVAVSLQKRIDPTMKPADVGHPYLPQEVVTHADYMAYKTSLRHPDLSSLMGIYDISEEACATGACPTR